MYWIREKNIDCSPSMSKYRLFIVCVCSNFRNKCHSFDSMMMMIIIIKMIMMVNGPCKYIYIYIFQIFNIIWLCKSCVLSINRFFSCSLIKSAYSRRINHIQWTIEHRMENNRKQQQNPLKNDYNNNNDDKEKKEIYLNPEFKKQTFDDWPIL